MLVETFTADNERYLTGAEFLAEGGVYQFGTFYHDPWPGPYIEKINTLLAALVAPPNRGKSEASIYLAHWSDVRYWPGTDFYIREWDEKTGSYLGRNVLNINLGSNNIVGATRSRNAVYYWVYDGTDGPLKTFDTVTFLPLDSGIVSSFFDGLPQFTCPVIDEQRDLLIDVDAGALKIWKLSTGVLQYQVGLSGTVVDTALEDENHVWLLMSNGMLVLFDYINLIVLGAVKVPRSATYIHAGWALGDVKLAWDWLRRRVLVIEKVANAVDGACLSHFVGYRTIPVATRLTTPIPLQVARKGETVQLMTALVGDMNEPVGGAIINATVTGDATLQSLPTGDQTGRAFMRLLGTAAGDATVACSATIPDYIDVGS